MGLGVVEGDRGLPGEQLGQLELVFVEMGFVLAHPGDVQGADHLAADRQRDNDHRFGLERRARDLHGARVEVSVIGQDGLVPVDDPAGDPDPERADVVHDHVGEPVTGDDRAADRRVPVDPIDGQRVVGHDRLERVRDHLQDRLRVERR